MLRGIWLVFLLVFSFSSMACLKEGDKVVLTGVMKKETVYGPPGWGESPKKDEKMDYWFFYPDKSLGCISDVDDSVDHSDKKLQMIMSREKYSKYGVLLDKNIKLDGQIMFANSPYHSTPLLIYRVSGIELVKGKNEK